MEFEEVAVIFESKKMYYPNCILLPYLPEEVRKSLISKDLKETITNQWWQRLCLFGQLFSCNVGIRKNKNKITESMIFNPR